MVISQSSSVWVAITRIITTSMKSRCTPEKIDDFYAEKEAMSVEQYERKMGRYQDTLNKTQQQQKLLQDRLNKKILQILSL